MEYSATAKYIRTTPRKLRLVVEGLRGQSAERAMSYLSHLEKRAAGPVMDVLKSVIANAKQKNAPITALTVTSVQVMNGTAMKRWHAVSKGSAHAFKKRMSHIKIVVTDDKKQEEPTYGSKD